MQMERSSPVVPHAHRGLRAHLLSLAAALATALLSMVAARSNPFSPIVVIVCGTGVVLTGRSLRAVGALIRVVQPPPPRWIAWLVPFTFLIGPLISAIGARLLFDYWRPAP